MHLPHLPRPGLSRTLLSRRELRFASRGAAVVAVVGAVLIGGWLSPWSPAGMDKAERLAASGDLDGAVDAWLDVAESHPRTETRRQAAWQAAWLASVDADDPQRAVELLRDYAAAWPADAQTPVALGRLGTLYHLYLDDPVRAGEAWQAAAAAAPGHPDAGTWLLDAGLAFLGAGLPDRAQASLAGAAEHADTAVAAHLALGRLALQDDAAEAYDHYSVALRSTDDSADRSLARLGAASALEALDEVDQALAELQDADDGDQAAERRRARLQAREQR